MSDYEEDFWDLPSEYKKNQKNHWSEHTAQSRHYNIQQEVEPQQKFHHFLMGQHPGLNTRS